MDRHGRVWTDRRRTVGPTWVTVWAIESSFYYWPVRRQVHLNLSDFDWSADLWSDSEGGGFQPTLSLFANLFHDFGSEKKFSNRELRNFQNRQFQNIE